MKHELPPFEQLMVMAQENPLALEDLRRQQIEQLIDKAPAHLQKRLRGLQFQIDCKRETHKNPVGACVAISKMMLDSLRELNSALHSSLSGDAPAPQTPAPVLRFPSAANQ